MIPSVSGSKTFTPAASCHEGSLFSHGCKIFSCKDCAIRIQNAVSKYFIELIEIYFPLNLYKLIVFIAKSIYWDLKECRFGRWLEEFKSRVQPLQTTSLYEGKLQFDSQIFSLSAQYHKLKQLFPVITNWENKRIDWIELKEGACFGESLAAMKYHRLFDASTGFTEIENEHKTHLQNDVIYFQALQELRRIHEGVLTIKMRMDAQHMPVEDIASKEPSLREAWLFHYLRKVEVSRPQARYLCQTFPELFSLSSDQLRLAVETCDRILEEDLSSEGAAIQPLDREKYSNENDYEKRTQQELDKGISDFLCQHAGVFSLICGGQRKIGHAMFLKIEQGKCIAFDPATKISFVTDHTPEGIGKTVELMKKMLLKHNLGGKLYFKVMSLD